MIRQILFTVLVAAGITSCDVRKKDQQASATMSDTMSTSKEAKTSTAAVPTDVTTVQIIDSVYDFGKVMDGDVVEFSYRFKNIGQKPLVITSASASCGCTVPEKPDQPILPGEIGYIKVKFNSENRQGEAHKTVTVTSNADPAFPQLLLKGQVLPKG
jgi:hypothetical protein